MKWRETDMEGMLKGKEKEHVSKVATPSFLNVSLIVKSEQYHTWFYVKKVEHILWPIHWKVLYSLIWCQSKCSLFLVLWGSCSSDPSDTVNTAMGADWISIDPDRSNLLVWPHGPTSDHTTLVSVGRLFSLSLSTQTKYLDCKGGIEFLLSAFSLMWPVCLSCAD